MAKAQFNRMLERVSGRVGRLITKRYRWGHVMSSLPDMSRVKPSMKQRAERASMEASSHFYWRMKQDPANLAWLEAQSPGARRT